MAPVVELRAATIAYGRQVVLSRLSLVVPNGAMAAVVGPSAAGKSSLLRCLVGRLAPRAGEVQLLGEPLARARRRVGYVPLEDPLDWSFPISVAEVVMMGRSGRLGPFRRPSAADAALTRYWIERVGLGRLEGERIGSLGPAERRQVLLARALVQEPSLLVVDEPWAGPGGSEGGRLMDLVAEVRPAGTTVLVATRELADLANRFDWVILLNGRLIAQGPPPVVLTAEQLEAAYGPERVLLRVPAVSLAIDDGADR